MQDWWKSASRGNLGRRSLRGGQWVIWTASVSLKIEAAEGRQNNYTVYGQRSDWSVCRSRHRHVGSDTCDRGGRRDSEVLIQRHPSHSEDATTERQKANERSWRHDQGRGWRMVTRVNTSTTDHPPGRPCSRYLTAHTTYHIIWKVYSKHVGRANFHKQEDALLQAFKPSVCTSNKLRQAAYIQHVHVNEITNASDECMINNPLCHEHLIRHMAHFCVTHATTYVLKILPHRAIQVSERCMWKT